MIRTLALALVAMAAPSLGADFLAITSSSCPPCAALKRDYQADARFTWEEATPEARERHKVRSVPTVIARKDGREIGRHVGYKGRAEMERWLKSMEAKDARKAGAIPPASSDPAARH